MDEDNMTGVECEEEEDDEDEQDLVVWARNEYDIAIHKVSETGYELEKPELRRYEKQYGAARLIQFLISLGMGCSDVATQTDLEGDILIYLDKL